MRILHIVSLLFVIFSFLFVGLQQVDASHFLPACHGIYGRFTATNWPAGYTLDVACNGDSGSGGCVGNLTKGLTPGDTFDLGACTCFNQAQLQDGCLFTGINLRIEHQSSGQYTGARLVVGDFSLPPGCTRAFTGPAPRCGSNGYASEVNFHVSCPAPNYTPTPTSVPNTPTMSPTPTPPRYSIGGKVYVDRNSSGTHEGISTEPGFQDLTVSLSQGPTNISPDTTDGSGDFRFDNLLAGTYTVNVTYDDSNYKKTDPNGDTSPASKTITVGPSQTNVRIGLIGKYSVSGNAFVDDNFNRIKDGQENNYPTSPLIAVSQKPSGSHDPYIVNQPDGTYHITNLIQGRYAINYDSPAGYFVVYPQPPTFAPNINTSCTPGTWDSTTGGACEDGNITNLNFGISQAISWFQSQGGDLRFDNGFSNSIPTNPNALCEGPVASRNGPNSTTPGVVFSGGKLPVFGSGTASVPNWKIGNSIHPEIYNPINPTTLRTSYEYVEESAQQRNETFVTLPCDTGSCSLSNLGSGYYRASNSNDNPVNLVLNNLSIAPESKIVILVDGVLRINTTVDVPQGSSLVVIVKGDITVSQTIGSTVTGGSMQCPPPGHLEGLYSTDNSFILESGASCSTNVSDRLLAIEGGIVVNANLSGGSLQNKRTLCDQNTNYPSFIITERPDMILTMPNLLKIPTYTWQEVSP